MRELERGGDVADGVHPRIRCAQAIVDAHPLRRDAHTGNVEAKAVDVWRAPGGHEQTVGLQGGRAVCRWTVSGELHGELLPVVRHACNGGLIDDPYAVGLQCG